MNKDIKDIDLVILGGGPAGLTAGIYASRAKLNMIILENSILGGQVRNSYTIENYPGFKNVEGSKLADIMQEQAEELGAVIDEFDPVEDVRLDGEYKLVETESYIYKAKSLIIATGASPRKLPIPNEGKFLTRFAKKVYLIRRYDYFRGEKSLLDQVEKNEKIEILYNEDLVNVEGTDFVEKAIIKNTLTGEEKSIDIDGVFGYIGTEPKTDMFGKYINLTKNGYIITDENMNTNIPGVYAAGDVREKLYRQITTAVADGTIAALEAEKFIISNRSE